jgi:hypothetical protein
MQQPYLGPIPFRWYQSPSGVWWTIPEDGGKALPRIAGGDDEEDPPKPKPEDQGDKDGKFTQEQVNQIGSREKKEGRKAATKELLEKLGFESIEDAEEAVKGWRKKDDDAKDEETKRREKLEADNAEAEQQKKETAREKRIAKAERRLVALGLKVPKKTDKDGNEIDEIDEDAADKLLQRAIKNLEVDWDKDIDTEDLTAAIADLKKDLPILFVGGDSGNGDDGKTKRQSAPPPARPPRKPGSRSESAEKARSALEQIFPDKVKPAESA